jgi:hypothetical protein
MNKDILAVTAALMETYGEADAELRGTMASHLAGSLAISGSISLREHRLRDEEERRNFAIIGKVIGLLPQADTAGVFTVTDVDPDRAVEEFRTIQRHAVKTVDMLPGSTSHYIIGSRPVTLPIKTRKPLTELLLWPANKGLITVEYYFGQFPVPSVLGPLRTSIPTEQFSDFQASAARNSARLLSKQELTDCFDTGTGNLIVKDSHLSMVRGRQRNAKMWWPGPEHVAMDTIKPRGRYETVEYANSLPDDIIDDFHVLQNLIEIANDFGQGKAAAAVLRAAGANSEI